MVLLPSSLLRAMATPALPRLSSQWRSLVRSGLRYSVPPIRRRAAVSAYALPLVPYRTLPTP